MFELKQSQIQMITFVMVDDTGAEVPGLADTFTLMLSKAGGLLHEGFGAKSEIGGGWYLYSLTANDTNTVGPLSISVTGAGCIQQNLEYVVRERGVSAIAFTYTVYDSVTMNPIEGVDVWVSVDPVGTNVVWKGETDPFGVARDDDDYLPRLDPGTYYFFRQKAGYTFADPDTEVVS